MKILKSIGGLKKAIINIQNLGFVPTMGGLHKGHISLIKESKKKCKKTIVSIYVNSKQFDSQNDFLKYPRNLNKDVKLLKKLSIDFLFIPSTKEIYKTKYKKITLPAKYKCLCAKHRKAHFEGVLNIMNRFIKLINPKYIFMGEKDYQQLFLIKKILINTTKSRIYNCKTVRDKNHVALSSRNYLLTRNDMITAGYIAKNLYKFKKSLQKIKSINSSILNKKKELVNKFSIKIEYLEARNLRNFKIYKKKSSFKLFVAYYLNKIRLIDNF